MDHLRRRIASRENCQQPLVFDVTPQREVPVVDATDATDMVDVPDAAEATDAAPASPSRAEVPIAEPSLRRSTRTTAGVLPVRFGSNVDGDVLCMYNGL